MLRKIFNIQLRAIYHSMVLRSNKKNKKTSKVKIFFIALLAIYVVAACMFSVGTIFHMMAGVLPGWLYFSSLALMAFGASVMLTVFSCQSLLFEAKDNELLLAMPIKPSHILGGRMLVLMLLEYLTSLVIMLPAVGIYAWVMKPAMIFYPFVILAILALPLLGLAVSCILGYQVSVLTKKIGSKSFITILYLAFIGIYMWGYTSLLNMAIKAMEGGTAPDAALQKMLPPIYRMGMALGELDIISMVYFLLWCAVPFGIVYYMLSRSFISITTASRSGRRITYKEKTHKKRGAFKALLSKEITRFFGTPIYLLNNGIGFLLAVILGVVILIKGPGIFGSIFNDMPELAQNIEAGVVAMLCFLAVMSTTTAPSISLEGKNLWILKSSPIKTKDIFDAKVALNLLFGIPTLLFAGLCTVSAIGVTATQAAIMVLIPISLQIFSAIVGLVCNLYYPNLNAVNETAMVKQGVSVLITMLLGFAFLGLLVVAYSYIAVPFEWLGAGAFVFINIVNVCLYKFLMNKGVKMFEEL